MSWWLYTVRCKDGSLYTGVTTDLERRVNEHNDSKRGAKYTRSRRPVELVYTRECENRSQAQKAEWAFKQLPRAQKLQVIKDHGCLDG
jgi:putative endonuclease